MNPLIDPSSQQPKLFSARLGELAAKAPQNLPFQPLETPGSRLQAILSRLRQPGPAGKHALRKLQVNEFMSP